MELEIIDVIILFLAISTLLLLSLSLVKENKVLKEKIRMLELKGSDKNE